MNKKDLNRLSKSQLIKLLLNPISTGFFGWCSTRGVFHPLEHSSVFKVNRILPEGWIPPPHVFLPPS